MTSPLSLPLSACCLTHVSPAQTRAALATLRPVAAEIVLGIDARRASQVAEYEAFADRVILLPQDPRLSPGGEGHLAALHRACRQPWVLRLDSDEIASPALVAALPALVADDEVLQYRIARRWLTGDGTTWIDEAPWWPDYQIRLVRRRDATFSGALHSSADPVTPSALVLEPLYHADCLLTTQEARQAKVVRYAVGGTTTSFTGTARMYEPERFATYPAVPVPPADVSAVRDFLAAAGHVAGGTSGAAAPAGAGLPEVAALGSDLPEVLVTPAERDMRFGVGRERMLSVEVTNRTATTWSASEGPVFLSYHWRWDDGEVEEGVRTPFPRDVAPGASCVVALAVALPERLGAVWLDVEVVHEHVRWLDGGARIAASVLPAETQQTAREVRSRTPRTRGWLRRRRHALAIPRTLHRVWLGTASMPESHREYGESWRRHHPDWELKLWTDADAPAPPGIERARNLAERADLVRYEILRRHGGVYVDTDVECLRPIDGLLDGVGGFAAYEVPGRLCNAVLGAVPGHRAFERAVELAALTVGRGTYPQATATEFLTYVLEAHTDVTLFGPERFYPVLWDDRVNPAPAGDPPYAIHHWAMSWVAAA